MDGVGASLPQALARLRASTKYPRVSPLVDRISARLRLAMDRETELVDRLPVTEHSPDTIAKVERELTRFTRLTKVEVPWKRVDEKPPSDIPLVS